MEKPKSKSVKYLYERYIEGNPELEALYEEERTNAEIAMRVYGLRKEAGLTQKELADLIGTDQAVISRLEDVDYQGHSLTMLRRIAAALGKRVQLTFVPLGGEASRS